MSFAGVLMRSRASVTPSTMRVRSAASTPSGTHQTRPCDPRPCGSARNDRRRARRRARQAARHAAHSRNDRGRPAATRRGCRAGTGRARRPAFRAPNRTAPSAPSGAGQSQNASRLGLEAGGIGKGARGGVELAGDARASSPPSRTRSEWPWMRRACPPARISNASGLSWRPGCLTRDCAIFMPGRGRAAPVNHSLGLTIY